MLTGKQIKKLNFLNESISKCKKCERLYHFGKAYPYFTRHSKYLAMAEAPGEIEVQDNYQTPLVGRAGRKLFSELSRHKINLKRKDFVLLNTVQCRPVENGKNGKPTEEEIENCRFWTERYIEVFEPKLILALGNYALRYFFDDVEGITHESGNIRILTDKNANTIKVMPCLHPASLLYSTENFKLFRSTLKAFKKEASLLK